MALEFSAHSIGIWNAFACLNGNPPITFALIGAREQPSNNDVICVFGLLSGIDLSVNDVLLHLQNELNPIPSAIFYPEQQIRRAESSSYLAPVHIFHIQSWRSKDIYIEYSRLLSLCIASFC